MARSLGVAFLGIGVIPRLPRVVILASVVLIAYLVLFPPPGPEWANRIGPLLSAAVFAVMAVLCPSRNGTAGDPAADGRRADQLRAVPMACPVRAGYLAAALRRSGPDRRLGVDAGRHRGVTRLRHPVVAASSSATSWRRGQPNVTASHRASEPSAKQQLFSGGSEDSIFGLDERT